MFGSGGVPKDLNFFFPVDREKEEGDAHHQQQEQQPVGSGIHKYRAAPSNLLGEVCEEFLPHRSTGEPEVARDIPCSFTQLLFHSPHRRQQSDAQISALGSVGVDQEHNKAAAAAPNLARHGSSPAGTFSQFSQAENGFSANRLKTQTSFSSRQASSGYMSQISETSGGGSDGSPEDSHDARGYVPSYPVATWEDSVLLSNSFNGSKRGREPLGGSQNEELRNHGPSSEYIEFQEAVPWKLRAKRGCATHPRSIAERVRRTKISERMRKLQELVPNMDKQTSTADMLDLAVEYVRELQDQIKRLTECRSNCTCGRK